MIRGVEQSRSLQPSKDLRKDIDATGQYHEQFDGVNGDQESIIDFSFLQQPDINRNEAGNRL